MSHYLDFGSYIKGEEERMALLGQSNIDFQKGLSIGSLFVSKADEHQPGYSITEQVDKIIFDEYGIKGERHRFESGFRESKRESHIYEKGSIIRQERHFIVGTDDMADRISRSMGLNSTISPQTLGWNIVFYRDDGEAVYLDGLPIGTDFMVYPEGTSNMENKTQLIANLRLVTHQNGCGITGRNVAHETGDKTHFNSFKEHSKNFRGLVLTVDGPVGEKILEVKQKVFIGLPTGHIK